MPSIDPVASHRWLARQPAVSPWLHEEVGARMADRLAWIQQPPASWLDWNPALGGWAACRLVANRYEKSDFFLPSSHDLNLFNASKNEASFWQKFRKPRVWGGGPRVIAEGGLVGMIWSNMLLHAVHQPRQLMQSWYSRLQVHGFLMFSGLGPDSLVELRHVYQILGWPCPTHSFTDMHDWGDMLVASGFVDPVMDTERVVLTYSSGQAMLDDLRSFGRNLSMGRSATVCSRAWRGRLAKALESDMPRDVDGRLMLTLEVVYGHAYKGVPKPLVTPVTRLSVADMKVLLGKGHHPT